MDRFVVALANWWGNQFLKKICTPLAMALFISGTALAIIEVVRRYVFGVSFVWQQDFVVAAVLTGTCVYFAVTEWGHAHIAVTFIREMVELPKYTTPRRVRITQLMQATADVITTLFLTLLIIWGLPMISQYKALGIKMPSQSFPFWPFWVFFMIGLIMYAVTGLIHAYLGFRGIAPPISPEDEL